MTLSGLIDRKTGRLVVKDLFATFKAMLEAHKDRHDPEDGADPLDTANASEIAGGQAAQMMFNGAVWMLV